MKEGRGAVCPLLGVKRDKIGTKLDGTEGEGERRRKEQKERKEL